MSPTAASPPISPSAVDDAEAAEEVAEEVAEDVEAGHGDGWDFMGISWGFKDEHGN